MDGWQNINGKEMYSGILIYPRGKDPRKLLQESPEKIAFAVGASSGESSAKAATAGKARFRTPSHTATAGSVRAGKAVAGFVKNWWWQSNKHKYPDLEACDIPGVSELKNPDNVLTASQAVSYEVRKRIAVAAVRNREAFGASEMIPFDSTKLEFSLGLMKKGGIDPSTYTWK